MSKSPLSPSNTLLSGPWNAAWWRSALAEVRSFRTLILAALLLALRIVISSFYIPVGENLKIFFSFFVSGLGGVIFGPFVALLYGFASDILGYILHPDGGFFPGYVLSAMAGAFFYALFLYRSRITVLRIFLCKACINLLVNVGLGSLWSAMIYGKGYYYYLVKSVIKNLTLLPVETFLLVIFLGVMLPVMSKSGIVPAQPQKRIPLW
ncbi:MAG: folate family ECF transporter S component [Angelakisella sp.]|nr:folate family ECF transporter S component [Angelakisella sp.]